MRGHQHPTHGNGMASYSLPRPLVALGQSSGRGNAMSGLVGDGLQPKYDTRGSHGCCWSLVLWEPRALQPRTRAPGARQGAITGTRFPEAKTAVIGRAAKLRFFNVAERCCNVAPRGWDICLEHLTSVAVGCDAARSMGVQVVQRQAGPTATRSRSDLMQPWHLWSSSSPAHRRAFHHGLVCCSGTSIGSCCSGAGTTASGQGLASAAWGVGEYIESKTIGGREVPSV